MKSRFSLPLCLGVACLMPAIASAQTDFFERFYAKVDLGGAWNSKTELKEFFGPVQSGSEVTFDPGVRMGLAVGYEWTDWFASEIQFGGTWTPIDEITGASRVDAVFGNAAVLLNGRLQLPNATPFTPYIGAGLGGSASVLDADEILLNDVYLSGSASSVVFACQGFAGVRYTINEFMGLSLEYRYFWADAPEFEADFVFFTYNDRVKMGRSETHSISLAFDFRF